MSKRETKQKSANKIILATIATTIIAVTLSFARYQSTLAGSDTAVVATPVITLSEGVAINLSISPNTDNEYVFEVSNIDEDLTISQVSMEYTLQILTNSNLPLQFELYKCTQNGSNYDITGSNLFSGNGTTTSEIELDVDTEKISHLYKLIVSWDENDLDYRYSEEIDYIQVILSSKQVD